MKNLFFLTSLILLTGAGCASSSALEVPTPTSDAYSYNSNDNTEPMPDNARTFPGVLSTERISKKLVRLTTEKGDIVIKLYDETAPKTVSNFVALAEDGFYNGLTFHRREEGFVIQGGDPSGNGTGGPGYTFEDELTDEYQYTRGTVAMANRGPDTNGSQFFIMLADVPLPKLYSIFGEVVEGMDVVDEIMVGDKMTTVAVENQQ